LAAQSAELGVPEFGIVAIYWECPYFFQMRSFEFCLSTKSIAVPGQAPTGFTKLSTMAIASDWSAMATV